MVPMNIKSHYPTPPKQQNTYFAVLCRRWFYITFASLKDFLEY